MHMYANEAGELAGAVRQEGFQKLEHRRQAEQCQPVVQAHTKIIIQTRRLNLWSEVVGKAHPAHAWSVVHCMRALVAPAEAEAQETGGAVSANNPLRTPSPGQAV